MENTEFNPDLDMVYYNKDGKIHGGGYSINSILLNKGVPAAYVNNKITTGGGKQLFTEDVYKNFAVPIGLVTIDEAYKDDDFQIKYKQTHKMVDCDLYDKLLQMMDPDTTSEQTKHKKLTKKKRQNKRKNTLKKK
jgi:hypothetical protein